MHILGNPQWYEHALCGIWIKLTDYFSWLWFVFRGADPNLNVWADSCRLARIFTRFLSFGGDFHPILDVWRGLRKVPKSQKYLAKRQKYCLRKLDFLNFAAKRQESSASPRQTTRILTRILTFGRILVVWRLDFQRLAAKRQEYPPNDQNRARETTRIRPKI